MTRLKKALALAAIALVLPGCGENNAAPIVVGASVSALEDASSTGVVSGQDADGDPVKFSLSQAPGHGTVQLDAFTGTFTYTPASDFNGSDKFHFRGSDGKSSSQDGIVTITVAPSSDPIELNTISDQSNSPYTLDTVVELPIKDVDGDLQSVIATIDDPSVARIEVSTDRRSLRVTPLQRGEAFVVVTASDPESHASSGFRFSVRDVTQITLLPTSANVSATQSGTNAPPGGQVVEIRNTTDSDVTFRLKYNGHESFTTAQDAARFVAEMPAEYPGEPFQRKLWRFVRDNTYHNVPINAEQWWYDMWATMNSLGFGFCGHVAAVYIEIAKAAGYPTRMWALYGHVVPEIFVDGRWEMYDPDIAVYYFNRDYQVAGVEDLQADPDLVSNPTAPIFMSPRFHGYSPVVRDIYATTNNNRIDDFTFASQTPTGRTEVTLPGRARLLFPGHWTEPPVGIDGDTEYTISEYRQAALELPPGWVGTLNLPWVLWDVQGEGSVALDGQVFTASSDALRTYLMAPGHGLNSIDILSNGNELRLVFMINATWYDLLATNVVEITGKDVWALQAQTSIVSASIGVSVFPTRLRKPVP